MLAVPSAHHFRTWRVPEWTIAGAVMLYIFYTIYAGGDWMENLRFYIPIMPLCIILIVISIVRLPQWIRPVLPWASVGVLVLCLLQFIAQPVYVQLGAAETYWRCMAGYIHQHWPKSSLIALNMAGVIPYYAPDYRYLDMLGLNDAHIARQRAFQQVASSDMPFAVAHSKGDPAYILHRAPDYIIPGGGMAGDAPVYAAEKLLLEMPEFHALYAFHTEALTCLYRGVERPYTFTYFQRMKK